MEQSQSQSQQDYEQDYEQGPEYEHSYNSELIEQQMTQTVQEYEEKARKAARLASITPYARRCAIDLPLYVNPSYVTFLCQNEAFLGAQRTLLSYSESRMEDIRSEKQVVINWTNRDGVVNTPRYFFEVLTGIPIAFYNYNIIFKLSDKFQVAVDAGGVSRAVFAKAGEYIASIMEKRENGRYYLPASGPALKTSGMSIANVIRLSFMQGKTLGLPLSYGIIANMRSGVMLRPNIPLHLLVFLTQLDSPQELQSYIRYIEEAALPELAYHPFTVEHMPVLTLRAESDGTEAEVRMNEREEWLRRFLYHNLYYTNSYDQITEFYSSVGIWDPLMQVSIRTCAMSEIATLLGLDITLERMKEICSTISDDNLRTYMNRYLDETEAEQWKKILLFATGSPDPTAIINFASVRSGLPSAATCSNTIKFRKYDDYETFKREFEISLEEVGFGNA
jgi:hypothetical protein